jgi:radical SAM protein with 4Fe4S-binding SPASM domain
MKSLPQQIIDRVILLAQRPDPRKIISIHFAVTYSCNSQCKTCNIWKKYYISPAKQNEELKLDEIRDMFLNSKHLRNPKYINLTGGEPFLREDFVDLCGFFIDRYPKAEISISTNALEPESIVAKLEEIKGKYKPQNVSVYISLDGVEEGHNYIRGIAGAYGQVLKLIQLLKERVPAARQNVNFTVTPDNYKEIAAVHQLSRKLDVGFGIAFAQTSQAFYDNTEKRFDWDEVNLNQVESAIDLIINEGGRDRRLLPRILRATGGAEIYYLKNLVRYMRYRQRLCQCHSGTHSLFMDPYGNIFPCVMLDKMMGNIAESNFDDIWTSRTARQVREFIDEGNCTCWTPCEIGPSLLRNPNVILSNLKSFW